MDAKGAEIAGTISDFEEGDWRQLLWALGVADENPAWRAALVQLGRDLGKDTEFRVRIKMEKTSWGQTWWAYLTAEIGKRRPKDAGPWWWILEYADGEEVAEEVTAFFAAADERG